MKYPKRWVAAKPCDNTHGMSEIWREIFFGHGCGRWRMRLRAIMLDMPFH